MGLSDKIGKTFFSSKKGNKYNDGSLNEEFDTNNLLCRFVFDGLGDKVGESLAIDGDILIIKSGKKYLGVPLKHVETEEKTLTVKGLVDLDKAQEMGENWRKKSTNDLPQIDNSGERNGF